MRISIACCLVIFLSGCGDGLTPEVRTLWEEYHELTVQEVELPLVDVPQEDRDKLENEKLAILQKILEIDPEAKMRSRRAVRGLTGPGDPVTKGNTTIKGYLKFVADLESTYEGKAKLDDSIEDFEKSNELTDQLYPTKD